MKSVQVEINDGVRIKAESLKEAIEQHEKIKQVVLFWTCSSQYYSSCTTPFDAYVAVDEVDVEYSFQGDREDALEYAENYTQWDGQDFVVLKGDTLYGFYQGYDNQSSWHDGRDYRAGLATGIDPSWIYLIRLDYDPETDTEYVLSPGPIPEEKQ